MAAAATPTPVDADITLIPDLGRTRSTLWPAAVLGGCISAAALGVVALYLVATPTALTEAASRDQLASTATTRIVAPLLSDDQAEAGAEAIEPTVDRSSEDEADTASDTPDDGPSTKDEYKDENKDEDDLGDELQAGKVDRLEDDEVPAFDIDGTDQDEELSKDLETFENGPGNEDQEQFGLLTDKSDHFGPIVDPDDPAAANSEEVASQVATVGPGVFGSADNDAAPLAGLTAIEDLWLTSASALGDLNRVYLSIDGYWIAVDVTATDPWSDLALLALPTGSEPVDGAESTVLEAIPAVGAGATVSIGDAIHIGAEPTNRAPGPRGTPNRGFEEPMQSVPIAGQVIDLDVAGTASGGLVFHDLIRSNISFETGFAGMPLFDSQDQAVGLIVDGYPSHNVSAIPIERVLRYGRSLRDLGVADPAFLGCDLVDTEQGLVEVAAIQHDGPADGVLLPGDQILLVNGIGVNDRSHLVTLIRNAGTGTTAELVVRRDGRIVPTALTIGGDR